MLCRQVQADEFHRCNCIALKEPDPSGTGDADDDARGIQLIDICCKIQQSIQRAGRIAAGDTGKGTKLTDDDEQSCGVHESGDHRQTEQVDEAAHVPQAQQEQEEACLQTQDGCDTEIGVAVRRCIFAHRGGDHQRGHRHRSNHELPGRTEKCVDHHGNEARV